MGRLTAAIRSSAGYNNSVKYLCFDLWAETIWARVNASRKVQIVLASGTGLASPSPRKGDAVLDQELGALVQQRTARLQDQHLPHEYYIAGRARAPRDVRAWHGGDEVRAEV
jgi:hypothetical protein